MTAGDAPESEGELVRIVVPLDRDPGDGGPEEEWIWAEPIGASRYRVESSPFFAYGLSHGDVVFASDSADLPRVDAVERKSGHRTIRFALDADWDTDRPEIRLLVEELGALGCHAEALPPKIVAVDLPGEVDELTVVRRLQTAVGDGLLIWEWADPRPS
jgi:uncharacterized protein DUF4265